MSIRSSVVAVLVACVGCQLGDAAAADAPVPTFQAEFGACEIPVLVQEEERLKVLQLAYEAKLASELPRLRSLESGDSAQARSLEADLRPMQADLLRILERLECKRLSALQDTVMRGPAAPKLSFVEVRIHYATDRQKEPVVAAGASKDLRRYFSGRLDEDFKDFSYGKVSVTIPTQRQPGELNLPSFGPFVGQPDQAKYFVLRAIEESNRDALLKELNDADANNDSTLLLFVHGFNVTFTDAAMRTAQLAHDLQFPGKVMLYSWPSAGDVRSYWKDEDSSRISTPRFGRLLEDLLKTKIKRIFVIAHSMGTRIVIPSVSDLVARGANVSKVSELLLAAADFNLIEFRELAISFAQLRAKGTRTTIYASSQDFALAASRRVHDYRRLGESHPTLNVFAGLDSVDASSAAPLRRAYGHSYVSDSREVLGDMQDLLLKRFSPSERGLESVSNTTDSGWRIPKTK